MTPLYRITADNIDVTKVIRKNFVSMTLSDKRNLEADQLDIHLADPEGEIVLPRKGVKLRCWIGFKQTSLEHTRMDHSGFKHSGLVYKGSYTVDEVTHQGPPDSITIRARSADFTGGLKQEHDISYDGKSIREILLTAASENNLDLAIEENLGSTIIEHLDQTNESYANLITRLSKQYDALATIKDDKLLFIPVGYTKTVSGIALPRVTITRKGSGRHSYVDADRDTEFSGVIARWHNLNTGYTYDELAGKDGNVKTLKETFPTKDEAAAAAKSKWQEMSRANKTMRISLGPGQPELMPNSPVRLTGWRSEIDSVKWVATDITHRIDSNGLSTDVPLEESSS